MFGGVFSRFFQLIVQSFGIIEINLDSIARLSNTGNVMVKGFEEVAIIENAMRLSDKKAELRAIEEKNKAAKSLKAA